ncbi:MAG TPA: hypothetical protein DC015_14775, partial [Aequorivita sp.]|nr:hypothetical protein [Aequorivita sp.]
MKKLILLLTFVFPLFVFSQPVTLFQQFNGRYDFTAVGNTLNASENNAGYCDILTQSSASLALTPGQTFVSAHLYWSSVGPGDFDVAINGAPVSAQRIFSHTFNGNPYFAAYADVTDLVAATGNGTYTFSDLDVSAYVFPGSVYCGTNYGGWAIYVIYEDPSLLLNQISLFDGMESVSANNNSLDITLTNIDVSSDILSKIGFLAWEGDLNIQQGESLKINGNLISNALNPPNNAFNGTNSYIGPPGNVQNYNMDLDYYDLVGIVQAGDTSILIQLTSTQDYIIVNNLITSVNSELPDATIEIDDLGVLCQNGNIDVDYTVYNVNSTNELPANTPIAFYADAVLIGQTTTTNIIPLGGSESGTITLNIPIATPNNFNLRAVVDDIGNGTGIVAETDESNNEFIYPVDLSTAGILLDPGPACLGRPVILDSGVTDPPFNIQWFRNGTPIPGATNATLTVTTDGIYSVEAVDGICRVDSNSVVITFRPQPVANPAVDLYQCDYGTTAGVFNLTDNDANILGAQDPALFTIKYYQSYQDSFDDTNEILGGVHIIVPPSPQTIYARIEDNSGSCFDLTDFRIYFSRAIAGIVPVNASYCDFDGDGGEFVDLAVEFNSLVLDGEPSSSYNITYHGSQADADNGVNAHPNPYFVAAPGETVYIRLENRDDATCVDTTRSVDLIIDALPAVNMSPPNLIECDVNNDGFAAFDLTQQDAVITLGDPVLSVTYHGTLLDARNGVLPLPDPYVNDQIYLDVPVTDPLDPNYGTGGVWARVTSSTSSCTVVVPFALEVRFAPVGTVPAEPLRQCDDAVADGFTVFDLTEAEAEILGALDPNGFDLYYYEDLADAQLAGDLALTAPDYSAAIGNPGAYTNTVNPQDIYVLVVGNANSSIPPNPNGAEGCYDIVTLTLIVDPIPLDLGPFEMVLCDDELQGSTPTDEISTFDLTTQDILVTGGDLTLSVLWFETPADEAAGIPIADPTMYQNIATPQTVIGRVTSSFGCSNLITVTLTVLPNPNANPDPEPITICDDDDDGIVGTFDLTQRDLEILNGETDVTILYYETLQEAENAFPGTEIVSPYTNIVPYSQTVFARVTNQVPPEQLPCYTIVELELIVVPLPDAPDATLQDPLFACDEDGDGTAVFDLTVQDASVYGVQDPDDFVPVSYYESQADADAGTNAIAPADAFPSSGQTIWVRLESLATGCARVTPFEIEMGLYPGSGTANDLVLCDDEVNGSTDDDGISTFDLTLNTPVITNGDPTLAVYYYASQDDQNNDIRIADPSAYQNTISPLQEIFVTVVGQNTCRGLLSFFIIVNPNPEPVEPAPLVACDVDNNGFTSFDLESKSAEIRGGDPTLAITYHENLLDANTGNFPLASPYENIVAFSQTLYVRAAYGGPPAGTGCYAIVELELIVEPSPVVPQDLPDLIACDDDGFAEFDLTVQEDLI